MSVLVKFSCAPGAASKAILQLSCWHQTAFHSPPCQIPSAAHFSSLSLRKQKGLSPRVLRSAQAHQQLRVRNGQLSACWELPKRCRGRSGECSTDAAIPRLLYPERLGSFCRRRRRCTQQRLWAEPQPLLSRDALWPLPGVAVTTALTTNCVGRRFISREDASNAGASPAQFSR